MKTTIAVTDLDLTQGEICDSDCCPISLATNRNLKPTFSARTGRSHIEIVDMETIKPVGNFEMPEVAQKFVASFDGVDCDDCVPFSFEMDLPGSVIAESR